VLHYLGYRGTEKSTFPYCAKQKIAVVGYSPFGHGIFFSSSYSQSSERQLLEEIAKHHGKTPRQIVLNFLTHANPTANVFTIPKTSNPNHVRENSESMGWNLAEDEVAAINKLFPLSEHDGPMEMI
jgi:diketogulonate reductase-like aldo/keto reductase